MLNWGVLGLGNIPGCFMKSLKDSEKGKLYAVSSEMIKEIIDEDNSL